MRETTAATVSLHEEGIVCIALREGVDIEPRHVDEITAAASSLSQGKRHGNLVDARKLRYLSKETRDVFARQERTSVSAIALLLESSLQRTLGNLYLNVSHPTIPTRIFTDERLAVLWLREQNDRR